MNDINSLVDLVEKIKLEISDKNIKAVEVLRKEKDKRPYYKIKLEVRELERQLYNLGQQILYMQYNNKK